jgi:iron complex transport system substrate-binding protein
MKRLIIVCLTLASLLISTARTPAHADRSRAAKFPVTVVDDHGNRVHIARAPQRIVSLDPRDTETLFALGLEKRVVGDGGQYVEGATGFNRPFRYPSEWPSRWGRDYPVRSRQLPHIEGGCCGTPFNLETIESLTPDLVVAPYSTSELPTFAKLRELGLTVMILDPSTLHGILHDMTLVGRATGHERQAATVSATVARQLAQVSSRLATVHSRPRVYYEIDASNPTQPFTAGPGTYIDAAIRLAGGKNVADAVTSCSGTLCYPAMSLEAIVKLDPQIIVLGDAYEQPPVSPASVKTRGGWQTISAVRHGKIYRFDDELISRAGPRIGIGVQKLARLIHPEAFKKG